MAGTVLQAFAMVVHAAMMIAGAGFILAVIALRIRLRGHPELWMQLGYPTMRRYDAAQMRKLRHFIEAKSYCDVRDPVVRLSGAFLRWFITLGPWIVGIWFVMYGLRLAGWLG